MNRRRFLALAGSGTAVAVAGCLDGGGAAVSGDNVVEMTIDSYRPEELTVEPGTTVEFVNTSSHAHTVTAFQDGYPSDAEYWASGGFDTEEEAIDDWNSREQEGQLRTNEVFEHTFEIPGTYNYYCIPHYVPHAGTEMTGVIRVETDGEEREE